MVIQSLPCEIKEELNKARSMFFVLFEVTTEKELMVAESIRKRQSDDRFNEETDK